MTIFDSIRYPVSLPDPKVSELVAIPNDIFNKWILGRKVKGRLTEADYIELKRIIHEYDDLPCNQVPQ